MSNFYSDNPYIVQEKKFGVEDWRDYSAHQSEDEAIERMRALVIRGMLLRKVGSQFRIVRFKEQTNVE